MTWHSDRWTVCHASQSEHPDCIMLSSSVLMGDCQLALHCLGSRLNEYFHDSSTTVVQLWNIYLCLFANIGNKWQTALFSTCGIHFTQLFGFCTCLVRMWNTLAGEILTSATVAVQELLHVCQNTMHTCTHSVSTCAASMTVADVPLHLPPALVAFMHLTDIFIWWGTCNLYPACLQYAVDNNATLMGISLVRIITTWHCHAGDFWNIPLYFNPWSMCYISNCLFVPNIKLKATCIGRKEGRNERRKVGRKEGRKVKVTLTGFIVHPQSHFRRV